MRGCKVDGCNNKISNRETGYCHKHHLRFVRNGTTETVRPKVDKTKKCAVDECDRSQETSNGYCLKHYKRFKRLGSTELPSREVKKCEFCDRDATARGMCGKHYQNWARHGDPLHTDKYRQSTNKYGYKKSQGKYTVEHREIAEKIIGRDLRSGEVVHHINLDKLDNSESNLYVCKDYSEHASAHQQLGRIAGELVKLGIIGFKDGKYYINK